MASNRFHARAGFSNRTASISANPSDARDIPGVRHRRYAAVSNMAVMVEESGVGSRESG